MKKRVSGKQEAELEVPCYWVGLDWGESRHTVSVVDDHRNLHQQFEVGANLDGLQELTARLGALGSVAGIAIESTRNPVFGHLAAMGFAIYPVNPKMSKSWRDSNSVGGVKNDERDGWVLAVELARRHESLRPFRQAEPAAAELAGMCESLRDLIDQRTALLQRLKAVLRQYYAGVVPFFSDWSSPAAWRFLKRFPRPEVLARAKKGTVIAFLKASRIGIRPIWLERIDAKSGLLYWDKPANSSSLEIVARTTVGQLLSLQPLIDKLDLLIEERTRDLPEAKLLGSLPGAGKRLAPAMTAIVLALAGEKDRLQALRCVSGVALVEMQSRKRRRVVIRRRCNKHWRDVLYLFAHCSTASCVWAKAFYDLHREQGDRHASALRKLADKWLKIIDHMLEKIEACDENRYMEALRKSGSPVYHRICGKTCG